METLEALPHVIEVDPQLHRRQALSCRPRARSARATTPTGRALRPTRTTAACAGDDGSAPARPVRRGLDSRLRRAHGARRRVDAVCLAAPVGEFGMIHAGRTIRSPGSTSTPARSIRPTTCCAAWRRRPGGNGSRPRCPTARRCRRWRGGRTARSSLWLANLTGAAQTVTVEGLPAGRGRIARLDREQPVWPPRRSRMRSPRSRARARSAAWSSTPYAVLRVQAAG